MRDDSVTSVFVLAENRSLIISPPSGSENNNNDISGGIMKVFRS